MAKNGVDFEFELESFVDDVKKDAWKKGETALTQVGIDAQRNVVALVPVETGLLKNSITYAIAGKSPAKKSYKADRGEAKGTYEGTIGDPNELAVYIGSNVEYAAAVEFREAKHPDGGQAHFLRDGISNHLGDYVQAIKNILNDPI